MLDTRSADEATPDATETRRRLVGWREQDPVPGSLGSLVTRRWRRTGFELPVPLTPTPLRTAKITLDL
jgi:hypothetical protein